MEKYLKIPGNNRLINAKGVAKIVRSSNTLVITYAGGGTVVINHGSDPTANIVKLEDAIAAALASKWNEVLHPIESLPVTPTGALA